MRLRRLQADWEGMQRLTEESPLIDVCWTGNPPERYVLTFRCNGLCKPPEATQPSVTAFHQVELYLHANYPRQQPRLTWLTEIFHPNILSPRRNGGVCIGAWTPAESLAALCLRLGAMIQYQSYNPDDPLDQEAATWAREHWASLPIDARALSVAVRQPAGVTSERLEVTL